MAAPGALVRARPRTAFRGSLAGAGPAHIQKGNIIRNPAKQGNNMRPHHLLIFIAALLLSTAAQAQDF